MIGWIRRVLTYVALSMGRARPIYERPCNPHRRAWVDYLVRRAAHPWVDLVRPRSGAYGPRRKSSCSIIRAQHFSWGGY